MSENMYQILSLVFVFILFVACITIAMLQIIELTRKNRNKHYREIVDVKIKKLKPDAVEPHIGVGMAAGYDLSACIDKPITIWPGTTQMIGTGLSIELPFDYFGAIFARSGIATKRGLRPANCVGVCDSDYRGEYIVPLHNDSKEPQVVNPGERIAQLVFLPSPIVHMEVVDELSHTTRGSGGFGSTGK